MGEMTPADRDVVDLLLTDRGAVTGRSTSVGGIVPTIEVESDPSRNPRRFIQ